MSAISAPIVIADDHPLMRGALRQAVAKVAPLSGFEEAETLAQARAILAEKGGSLLLLDLHMNDSDGFVGLISLRQDFPAIPIVVVSASEDDWVVRRAMQFGASGYIPKSLAMSHMCEAFRTVLDGDLAFPDLPDSDDDTDEGADTAAQIATLTPSQLRILIHLSEGKLNKQIAYEMDITEATVKAHVTAVFRKLEVINRTQAVLKAKTLLVSEPQVAD